MILKYAIITVFKVNRRQFIEENVRQWTLLEGGKVGAGGSGMGPGKRRPFLGIADFCG